MHDEGLLWCCKQIDLKYVSSEGSHRDADQGVSITKQMFLYYTSVYLLLI